MPKRYLDRLQTIDRLIRIKATGTPRQLAQRLAISESRLYEHLALMKEYGAPIVYCKDRASYCYEIEGGFNFQFIGAGITGDIENYL